VTIVATDLSSMQLRLGPQTNWTPLATSGRAALPKSYHVAIDRDTSQEGLIEIQPGGGPYSNTWVVEIIEALPAHWRLEDGADDPTPAPGDATPPEIGPGKSLDKSQGAIRWSVGLGRLLDGTAAGRLGFAEQRLTPALYTPTNLYYLASSLIARDEVELVPVAWNDPTLRQVKAYQAFVDIVALTNTTELRFYLPPQIGTQTNGYGHYTNITGSAFVVWALANPAPPGTNHLDIVERRNGDSMTNHIAVDPSSSSATWTLRCGLGTEERVESRGVTVSTSTTTNRIETVDIRYANATSAAYHAQETYQLFAWGFDLVETRIAPGGGAADLVATITFNTDPEDLPSYRQPRTIVYPDGYWERRIYCPDGLPEFLALHPQCDSPSGPDQANYSNSVVVEYFENYINSYYPPVDLGSCLHPFKSEVHGHYQHGDPAYLQEENGFWIDHPNDSIMGAGMFLGTADVLFGEPCGFGYYKHPLVGCESTNGQFTSYYYNSVAYNPTSFLYTVDTVNPAWTGPDWRQCGVIGNSTFYYDDLDLSGALGVPEADGQPLIHPIDRGTAPAVLLPNRSVRQSSVYHNGSLVLRERNMFTGLDGNDAPVFDPIGKWVYQNDSLGHATNIIWIDGATSVSRVVYSADYRGTNEFDGELMLWDMDEQGIKTTYRYNSLKRLISACKTGVAASGSFPAQADITTALGYDAYGRSIGQTNSSGQLSSSSFRSFDLAGRLLSSTDANRLTTTFLYELGGRRITTTLPSGGTQISENYLDRRLKSVTGTGVVNQFHEWEYVWKFPDEYPLEEPLEPFMEGVATMHTIRLGSDSASRVSWEGLDWAERPILTRRPDCGSTNLLRDYYLCDAWRPGFFMGHYSSSKDGRYLAQVWQYNADGTTNGTVLFPQDGQGFDGIPGIHSLAAEEGTDHRLVRAVSSFVKDGNAWFRYTTNYSYTPDPTVSGVVHERLSGFTDGDVLAEVRAWDADTNLTVSISVVNRSTRTLTQTSTTASSTLSRTAITVNGLLQSESSFTVAAPTRYSYDGLGRQTAVTSPLGFSAYTTYDQWGRVAGTTDFTGQSTTYEYYPSGVAGAGQVSTVTRSGKKTYSSYTLRGELYHTWGDVPYPAEYRYSRYGN